MGEAIRLVYPDGAGPSFVGIQLFEPKVEVISGF
jgi:hypothetical protein